MQIYEKNPRSKAFVPLAESYRRLGMYREALEVLKKGLTLYPRDDSAQVVLAHIYYDTQKYQQALEVLRPLASKSLEKYSLQRLYAHTNLKLGFKSEALGVFKMLLTLRPRDQEVMGIIGQLEAEVLQQQSSKELNQEQAMSIEGWVQVDFVRKAQMSVSVHEDQEVVPSLQDGPIVTHTLVDLYEKQGLAHRAIEVLEKMLVLNPDDMSLQKKLGELKRKEERQGDLMDLWEEKFSEPKKARVMGKAKLQEALSAFLGAVRYKSEERNSLNAHHGAP